jgi:hypothetical protein
MGPFDQLSDDYTMIYMALYVAPTYCSVGFDVVDSSSSLWLFHLLTVLL